MFKFKTLYLKLVVIFIGIWWLINWLSFGLVFRAFSERTFIGIIQNHPDILERFESMRFVTLGTLLGGIIIGSIAIVISARSIVKPIQALSKAARQITEGDYNINVKVDGKDEISQLGQDFNVMVKALESTDILRKEFVSNVSHEFKTPVTSIMGFAKLIKEGNINSIQVNEYCDIIIDESERLSQLSKNLLILSEIETEVIHETKTLFSLDEQIRRVVLLLEPFWQKKEIEVELNLEKITLINNDKLIQQIWINLITNAIKFSNSNSKIEINSYFDNGKSIVEIIDFGIGIKDKDVERIFERFYQVDTSRSSEGHGLGLVIVKAILEKLDGEISVQSELNTKTIFTVKLP